MEKGSLLNKSRLSCLMDRSQSEFHYSLSDYRNSYYISNNPDKIIEFYKGFENRNQLIEWMKERPRGVANVCEVEGDKDIVVVIPTANIRGKYAMNCSERIFKGLHIVFVESGEVPDPYFNYAHNCNVGIRRAMEYNPRWIVLSNDDMQMIDEVQKLKSELKKIPPDQFQIILSKSRIQNASVTFIGQNTLRRKLIYLLRGKYTRKLLKVEKKFQIKFFSHGASFSFRFLYKNDLKFPAIGDFVILSSSLFSENSVLFDEVFINGNEDIDEALDLYLKKMKYSTVDYNIESIGGGTLGRKFRMLKDIANLAYLNRKIESNIVQIKKDKYELF